uniref:Uncharacterized protein n=1 Tax=Anguilla anguilla TaxID=7936 RepID=A0A0E9X831_ANGAN
MSVQLASFQTNMPLVSFNFESCRPPILAYLCVMCIMAFFFWSKCLWN